MAIDINQTRLDFAKANGFAEDVHCMPVGERAKTAEEGLKRAKERITSALSQFGEEEGFDVIFECTGAEPCIQMSIHVRLLCLRSYSSLTLSLLPRRQSPVARLC